MPRKRKSHTAAVKAQVALAAVKGDKTVSELASLHAVHPTLIHAWKKQLVNNAEELFQNGVKASGAEHEALQAQLYEQIGRHKTALDWLQKKAHSFRCAAACLGRCRGQGAEREPAGRAPGPEPVELPLRAGNRDRSEP